MVLVKTWVRAIYVSRGRQVALFVFLDFHCIQIGPYGLNVLDLELF